MPTLAHATVVGHLYGPAELKRNDKGPWCRFRCWTADKVKPAGGGEAEKKFTSWGGLVSGPQAEWLARDGKKGSLVAVTGTVRLDRFLKADGTESYSIEFVRVSECRVLDAKEEAPAPAEPQRPATPAGGSTSGDLDDQPPFMPAGMETWA